MGPTWDPPGSCRPQMGPMLAPWTLLSVEAPFEVLNMLYHETWVQNPCETSYMAAYAQLIPPVHANLMVLLVKQHTNGQIYRAASLVGEVPTGCTQNEPIYLYIYIHTYIYMYLIFLGQYVSLERHHSVPNNYRMWRVSKKRKCFSLDEVKESMLGNFLLNTINQGENAMEK